MILILNRFDNDSHSHFLVHLYYIVLFGTFVLFDNDSHSQYACGAITGLCVEKHRGIPLPRATKKIIEIWFFQLYRLSRLSVIYLYFQ
jgi:hypothetical protein